MSFFPKRADVRAWLIVCASVPLPLACGSETPKPTGKPVASTTVPTTAPTPAATSAAPATSTSATPELPPPVVIVEGLKNPNRLALDATTIYISDARNGILSSAPKSGGAPKPLVSAQKGLAEIAVDATALYWTTSDGKGGGSVMKLLHKGGAPVQLAAVKPSDLGGPTGIEVDDKNVYWVVATKFGDVMRVAKTGGAASVVAEKQRSPYDIAGDGHGVYWTNFGSGTSDGTVMGITFGKPGEKPKEPVALATGRRTPWAIVVDATSAYWIDKGPPGAVMKVPLAGGAPTVLASDTKATLLAVDPAENGKLYWTSEEEDTLSSIAKSGGAATVLARGLKGPTGIALDETSIFVCTEGDGTVLKLAK